MEKITINDVVFCNFGSNNYTCGMELVSSYPCDPQIIEDVLLGRYSLGEKQVFLNPSAPCGEEFFGVLGTQEQYNEFYVNQKDAQISKMILDDLGGMSGLMSATREEYKAAKDKAEANYKDWWNK